MLNGSDEVNIYYSTRSHEMRRVLCFRNIWALKLSVKNTTNS